MGRAPVRLKEVIYGISSNKVEIMGSLGRDAFSTIAKKVGGGWFDVTVFGIAPVVGTVMCVMCIYRLFSFLSFLWFLKRGRVSFGLLLLVLLYQGEGVPATGLGRVGRTRNARPKNDEKMRAAISLLSFSLTRNHALSLSTHRTFKKQVRGELQGARETPPQILREESDGESARSSGAFASVLFSFECTTKNLAVAERKCV